MKLLIGISIFVFGLLACNLPILNEETPPEEFNPQKIALGLLEEFSESPVDVTFEGGFPTFVGAEVRVSGNSAPERAIEFLTRFKPLYLLDDPDVEFKVRKIGGFYGEDIYFYQTYKGLEIFGSELVVSLDGDIVYATTGKMLHDIEIDISPVLSGSEAEILALNELGGVSDLVVGETSLMIFDPSSLGDVPANPKLVWKVSLSGTNLTQLFIDATSGEILYSYYLLEPFELDIEDANGTNAGDDCYWWTTADDQIGDEDGIFSGINDPIADEVYDYAVRTFNFYVDNFNWYSYDGSDSELFVYIHTNVPNANWKSGFWCDFIEFNDSFVAYDIFVHEFTHAVINNTSVLIYADQSGALNESYADVMAAVADGDWQIGEDSVNGIIRDMTSPVIDHMNKFILRVGSVDCRPPSQGGNDCGWVHSNSGITNKAAYLIARGGIHNSWIIDPLGDNVVRDLFANIMVNLPSNASLRMARDKTVNLADRTLSPHDACQVRNAFASVGLGFGDFDCDGVEDNLDNDSDFDLVPDNIDNCLNVNNELQVDTDNDGQGDACDNDDDGDGINDLPDNCQYIANDTQEDTDGDGKGDACDDDDRDGIFEIDDNCPEVWNPDQLNTDSDAFGNECDDDDDNDGILDINDNCRLTRNVNQRDSDGDGVGDACDNCQNDHNPDQVNTDSDAFGNVCDDDDDNDGILDINDNCQLVINPRQGDIDLDGIGDVCDREDFPALLKMADNIGVMFSFMAFHEKIIKVPTEICLDECPDWFPENYVFGIEFSEGIPVDLGLMVSDQYGRLAGKTHFDNGKLVLHFRPKGGMRYFINVILASESELENGEMVEIGMNYSYGDYDDHNGHELFDDVENDAPEPQSPTSSPTSTSTSIPIPQEVITATFTATPITPTPTPTSTPEPVIESKPGPPSNFTLDDEVCLGASFNISLSWTDNSGNEDGFRIYRDGALVATLSANTTSYSENSGNTNSGYTFKVVAYNGVGESDGPSLSTSVCPFG